MAAAQLGAFAAAHPVAAVVPAGNVVRGTCSREQVQLELIHLVKCEKAAQLAYFFADWEVRGGFHEFSTDLQRCSEALESVARE